MKPTLGQVFTATSLGLTAILAALFAIVFQVSESTLAGSSEAIREAASREIAERVTHFLQRAPMAAEHLQLSIARGLVDPQDGSTVEPFLLGLLLANEDIGELSFTYGRKVTFRPDGQIELAPGSKEQWSVVRSPAGEKGEEAERLWSRHVYEEGAGFVADRREFEAQGFWSVHPPQREAIPKLPDPTLHATFTTPAQDGNESLRLWTDLHQSQVDAELPAARRRVEVSVQQALTDTHGNFAGVCRVGLLAQQISRIVQPAQQAGDPHRIFLCDRDGRLISEAQTPNVLVENGDDLRIDPAAIREPLRSALDSAELRGLADEAGSVSGHLTIGKTKYLTTFRALPGFQDWIVGIVVPESYYLGRLTTLRHQLLAASFGIMALVVTVGALVLRAVKRAQAQIVRESLRMNSLEFGPSSTAAPFRDVAEVLEGLEKAKSAMRAMGKYVPMDLVRRLYREKSEPTLGGEEMEISIMFTDVKGFTSMSELLPPDELAEGLGRYLAIMAQIIQKENRGTIDKFIGDAIMTIWNAPEPVPDHARMACRAALQCRDAEAQLVASPEWQGRPPFQTRFGLHREKALVGHFGAPDRLNYTAIGDAVNLASRLEGLNKHYGTSIIASECIMAEARGHFAFRLLDLVAVQGKREAIRIYELLGVTQPPSAVVRIYEEAFGAYSARDFEGAINLLEQQTEDAPSAALLQRCRELRDDPPPEDWRGVHVFSSK